MINQQRICVISFLVLFFVVIGDTILSSYSTKVLINTFALETSGATVTVTLQPDDPARLVVYPLENISLISSLERLIILSDKRAEKKKKIYDYTLLIEFSGSSHSQAMLFLDKGDNRVAGSLHVGKNWIRVAFNDDGTLLKIIDLAKLFTGSAP